MTASVTIGKFTIVELDDKNKFEECFFPKFKSVVRVRHPELVREIIKIHPHVNKATLHAK